MKLWVEKGTWCHKQAREKLAKIDPASVKRIAVIKHGAFGDLLLTRPLLITLRSAFPEARLTLSTISHYTRGTPEDLVDHVHCVPSSKDKAGLRKSLAAYRELGAQDLLLDITASTRSFTLSYLTQARFKIGFQHRRIHKRIYDVAIPRAAYRFEAETFLEQLYPLGIQFDWPPRFDMPVTALSHERPYIVYFPTASTPDKSWPADRFSALIGQMAEQLSDHDHVVLCGLADWEKQVATDIIAPLSEYKNIRQRQASAEDPALIRGADVLVSNDTGIRHLGIALETPTVGIFFHATPFGYWPRFGGHQVLFHRDDRLPSVEEVSRAMALALETANVQVI